MEGEHTQRKVKQVSESTKQRHRGKLHISSSVFRKPRSEGLVGCEPWHPFPGQSPCSSCGLGSGYLMLMALGGVSLKKLVISSRRQDAAPVPECGGR